MRRRHFIALIGAGAICGSRIGLGRAADRLQRRIGLLTPDAASDPQAEADRRALLDGLRGLGWPDGSIALEERLTAGDAAKVKAYADELRELQPDVIVTVGAPALEALRGERRIPIVFTYLTDPVAQGFVASMAHPGGNVTGFTAFEFSMGGKWVELLREMAPQITRVGILYNPDSGPYLPIFVNAVKAAVPSLAREAVELQVRDVTEIATALERAGREGDMGVVCLPDGFLNTHRARIIDLASRHRVPTMYPWSWMASGGGLMSYGVDLLDPFRQAADYVDRILKGESPAELPVQAPRKYDLVINVKTATAIGLTVPPMLLARADEVIE